MSDPTDSTVDITRQDNGDYLITIYGDDCRGEINSGQDRALLAADWIDLCSAQCTMLDRAELERFAAGISHLLNEEEGCG